MSYIYSSCLKEPFPNFLRFEHPISVSYHLFEPFFICKSRSCAINIFEVLVFAYQLNLLLQRLQLLITIEGFNFILVFKQLEACKATELVKYGHQVLVICRYLCMCSNAAILKQIVQVFCFVSHFTLAVKESKD